MRALAFAILSAGASTMVACGFEVAGQPCVGDACGVGPDGGVHTDGRGDGSTCDPGACTTPPDPACVSATQLRSYSSAGTCTDDGCTYPQVETTCPYGCRDGACDEVRYMAVAAGLRHTCALRQDGTLVCWGSNSDGQSTPPSGTFVAITVGAYHSCALSSLYNIVCWGENGSGQLYAPPGPFVAIEAGSHHTCAMRTGGSIACWGANDQGQAEDLAFPRKAVSAGTQHTCTLTLDDRADCWGDGTYGQSDPPSAGRFVQIAAGNKHTCGLSAAGSVTCWGSRNENPDWPALSPSGTFRALGASAWGTCGVKTSGGLQCWDVTESSMMPPTGAGNDYASVAVGGGHACGLRANGTLLCWGSNAFGQTSPPP